MNPNLREVTETTMDVELKVPQVGESITEVQIGEWLKRPGDTVAEGEALVVIETDKVTVELPAPSAGRLGKVLKAKGSTAAVGEVVGYLEAGAGAPSSAADETPARAAQSEPSNASGSKRKAAAAEQKAPAPSAKAPASAKPAAPAAAKPSAPAETRVMPAARRALAEHELEASEVRASGPGGRLLKEDVERQAAERPAAPAAAAHAATDGAAEREEIVPLSPLRKRIAERLVEAQRTAAILTTFNEVDLAAVMALRKAQGERFQERHGVKLGLMGFFVKAAVEALKRVPQLNAELRGDAIVFKNHYDLGIAVGGGKGLVVPVVRDAERLSFAEVERAIAELAERAKENKLTLEELTGGTFTISNGGIYGSLMSTPILNPPQSGILGLHAIQERPVVRDGAIVVRPMMYVALSYDHRLVDGREAVTFLRHVKECVEEPTRILLEI
jgi:2-oxoglutarate dehydrogenase E2 component (dihydrolipoamide succinyltransferase)